MKTKRMLLVAGAASGVALSVALVRAIDLRPMIVTNLTGNLLIHQSLPCDQVVNITTPVIRTSRLEISPAEGVDVPTVGPPAKLFMLTRMTVFFEPFTVEASCRGVRATRRFSEIGVQLGRSVRFGGALGDGRFNITIPKADFLIAMAVIDNRQSERGRKHPSDDVTGFIDLVNGRAQLHFVLSDKVHFQVPPGCGPRTRPCVINGDGPVTLTANISGTIEFPDTDGDGIPDRADTCPALANVTCTPVNPGQLFRVAAPTSCGPRQIRLGSFALANGEVVKIQETGRPGVRLINEIGPNLIKHFQVGKGEAIVTATDANDNVANAACSEVR